MRKEANGITDKKLRIQHQTMQGFIVQCKVWHLVAFGLRWNQKSSQRRFEEAVRSKPSGLLQRKIDNYVGPMGEQEVGSI